MFRLTIAIFGVLSMSGFAQEVKKIKTTIVTYALGAPREGFKAFYQSKGEVHPFGANGGGLSNPIRYEGPVVFSVRDSEEAFSAPPAGQQAPPPLASVTLPERSDNVLVIAAPTSEGKFRLVAFDVGTSTLKAGEYKIFNFSNSVLSLIMGKQTMVISPRENKMMRDDSWTAPEAKALVFKVAKVENGKPNLIKETFWEHWPARRNVIFFFDGSHKGEPIAFVSVNVEPPPREAASQ